MSLSRENAINLAVPQSSLGIRRELLTDDDDFLRFNFCPSDFYTLILEPILRQRCISQLLPWQCCTTSLPQSTFFLAHKPVDCLDIGQ